MMDELLRETEKALLESYGFRSKPQMQRLLKYLIKHSCENNHLALQQKSIAIKCLGRAGDFVPSQDPIVRIEAARLRKLLDAFYEATPQKLPYRISLPKGSYRVCFARNEDGSLSSGLGLLLVCQGSQYSRPEVLELMLTVRQELATRISCFHHVDLTVEHYPQHQVSQKGSIHFLAERQHDYVLRVEVVHDGSDGCLVSSVVIHRASQEILWSHSTLVPVVGSDRPLQALYKHVVRSLVSDSFGLLGNHWSKFKKNKGGGEISNREGSWVRLIEFINQPSASLGEEYLSFLHQRLSQCPNDHVAYAGYLCLLFYDFSYKLELFDLSLDERRDRTLQAVQEYPSYDVFPILLGLYCFVAEEYDDAKAYLETGLRLNPYNSAWCFLYGGVLFLTGEQQRGMDVINKMNKDFIDNNVVPSFYLLPEFLYRLRQEQDLSKVFQLGVRLGFNNEQWHNIGVLKDHPDLVGYCFKAIKDSMLEAHITNG